MKAGMFTALLLASALIAGTGDAQTEATDPKVADAKPGDIRVVATAAIREPLNAVLKQAETAIGKRIVVPPGD